MPFEFDTIHLVYLLVAASAGLLAEAVYLLFFNTHSYRRNINRRLQLMADQPNRETMLVQLRRERGLNVSVRSVNMYRHRVNKRRTREGR